MSVGRSRPAQLSFSPPTGGRRRQAIKMLEIGRYGDMGSGAATKKSQSGQGPLDERLALRTQHLEDLWKPPMSATQNFFLCASPSLVEL